MEPVARRGQFLLQNKFLSQVYAFTYKVSSFDTD